MRIFHRAWLRNQESQALAGFNLFRFPPVPTCTYADGIKLCYWTMSAYVVVRFEQADKSLLLKVCRSRREDVSSFVRRSVLSELARLCYLSAEQAQALGIEAERRIKR